MVLGMSKDPTTLGTFGPHMSLRIDERPYGSQDVEGSLWSLGCLRGPWLSKRLRVLVVL
jgi:hypothetical protein